MMGTSGANHERQPSIADSVVSAIPDEIRDRYRLSVRDRPPSASPSAFRPGAARHDSIFSFNTQWTADESFLESSGMIADFPRPPAMTPIGGFGPALPSSSAHAVFPSGWAHGSQLAPREPPSASQYTESSFHSQHTEPVLPSARSNQPLQPPNPPRAHRPNTAPSALTVRTDAAARYLDPNTNAPIEVVTGSGPTTPSPTSRFPPPTLPPPSGLPPLPRAPSSRSPSSPGSQYLVPTPPGEFPVAPLSPATAAFLNSPVFPPSSHASHEGLLDPRFIRTMMSGIQGGGDGLDLSISGDEQEGGPFGDRYAVEEAYYQDEDDEPLPAAEHRSAGPPATPASSPSNNHGSAGKETIASGSGVSTLTGGASSGGQSHLTGITEKSVSEEEAIVQHAALVRTASIAEMRPAVYTSAPTSPRDQHGQYAGDQRWSIGQGGAHARTTSADLLDRAVRNRRSVQQLQFLSVTHPDARRSAIGGVEGVWEEEEGEDLVYVRGEDLVGSKDGVRESTGKASTYLSSARESTFTGVGGSTYTDAGRDSGYVGSGRGSTYPGAWAEPASPNEMTPALGYAQPMTPGAATMPATAGHSTPGAGPSTLSPRSAGFSSPGPGVQTFNPVHAKKSKRASVTSYVSSIFSPFSAAHSSSHHASTGHQGTRTFAFSWRGATQQEEVPPLPTPSPHVARMWEAYYRAGGAPSAEHSNVGTTSD
ncbi:hypothetical protein FRC06_007825, partial [Ceratobasidium sp. 370]